MEVKELNSQLASLMNFGRVNVSAPSTGDAFAQLLNRPESEERPVTDFGKKDTKEVRSECPETKADKKNRRVVDNKGEAPVDAKNNNRADNDKKNDTSVSERNSGSNDNNKSVMDKMSAAEAPATPADDKASTSVETEAVPTENAAETAASADDIVVEAGDTASDKLSVAMMIPLEALALMGTINVINPQTNEMVQMTGAELATQLADNGSFMPVQQPSENGEPVIKLVPTDSAVTAPNAAPAEEGLDISLLKPLDDGEVVDVDLAQIQTSEAKKANAAKSAEPKAMTDDVVADTIDEQAAKLSEVIGEEQKVSVKVSAHEEKIARLSTKDLLADAKAVDEAVSVSAKPADVSAKINVEALKQPTQPAAGGNAQSMNAVPLFNAAAPTVAQTADVSATPVAANAETAPLNLSASVAAGGEFVKAAKADASAESNQTSFRDVYKGMSREVVEQVKVNITKSAVKGIDKIDISLKPEELGKIEVKMQIGKDGKLQAHIISSRPETLEALQKEMQSLEKAFNDAGFQTDEGSLSFSFREDNQANQNQERDNGLRNFIGDIFEKEASNDLLSGEAFQNQSWDGKSGLNIRV